MLIDRRSTRVGLALLLMLSSISLAQTIQPSSTIYLKVTDHTISLKKVIIKASIENVKGLENILYSRGNVSSVLVESPCCIKENVTITSQLGTKSLIIKRGKLDVNFAFISNKTSIDGSIRLKGSVVASLIFIRDSDIKVRIHINKEKHESLLKLSGFIVLTSPIQFTKNMLRIQVPRIKKFLVDNGVQVVQFKYNVNGRALPPLSKVEFDIVLRTNKSTLKSLLDTLNLGNVFKELINTNDNVQRVVTGEAKLDAQLKVSKSKEGNIMYYVNLGTTATMQGKYYNTTLANELSNRVSLIMKALNISSLSKYLIQTVKEVKVYAQFDYENNKGLTTIEFTNLRLANEPQVWKELYKLTKNNENVKIVVYCNGKTVELKSPTNPCGNK